MSCAIKDAATAGVNTSYASLQETAARIGRVSSLPHVAVQIMDIVSKPNSSASDLEKMVLMDPSLAARLLSIVNSAAYRARTEIRSVQHAIAHLGFKAVRNVALATALAAVFHDDDKAGGYCRRSLWRHLVSVGVTSRMIAARVGLRNAEDAFLAGLLHDFGIILMDQNCHSHFVSMMESLAPDETLPQAERRCFGFTHAELGAAVAAQMAPPSDGESRACFTTTTHKGVPTRTRRSSKSLSWPTSSALPRACRLSATSRSNRPATRRSDRCQSIETTSQS